MDIWFEVLVLGKILSEEIVRYICIFFNPLMDWFLTVVVMVSDGAAYTLGRINRDCWYLYTLDEVGVSQPDQTVEISLNFVLESI